MRESVIKYQAGPFWVMDDRQYDCYTVFKDGPVVAVSDSSYPRTDDGLSLAKARVDYLAKRSDSSSSVTLPE